MTRRRHRLVGPLRGRPERDANVRGTTGGHLSVSAWNSPKESLGTGANVAGRTVR